MWSGSPHAAERRRSSASARRGDGERHGGAARREGRGRMGPGPSWETGDHIEMRQREGGGNHSGGEGASPRLADGRQRSKRYLCLVSAGR